MMDGIRLSSKDLNLFRYLSETKIATASQINRDIYSYPRIRSLYERLSCLRKKSLIRSSTVNLASKRVNTLGLTMLAFKAFVQKGDETIICLHSDAPMHDLVLNDVCYQFRGLEMVKEYHCENQLQQYSATLPFELRQIASCRADAAVQIILNEGTAWIAVEYEGVLKSRMRIKQTFEKYYGDIYIPAVLYLCQNEAMIKAFTAVEREYFSDQKAKIFYCQILEFLAGETTTFSSRDRGFLELAPASSKLCTYSGPVQTRSKMCVT